MNRFVEVNAQICGGKPVVIGTRIPVTVVLDQLSASGSIEAVMDLYPELRREQIAGVLQYCHEVLEHSELEHEAA